MISLSPVFVPLALFIFAFTLALTSTGLVFGLARYRIFQNSFRADGTKLAGLVLAFSLLAGLHLSNLYFRPHSETDWSLVIALILFVSGALPLLFWRGDNASGPGSKDRLFAVILAAFSVALFVLVALPKELAGEIKIGAFVSLLGFALLYERAEFAYDHRPLNGLRTALLGGLGISLFLFMTGFYLMLQIYGGHNAWPSERLALSNSMRLDLLGASAVMAGVGLAGYYWVQSGVALTLPRFGRLAVGFLLGVLLLDFAFTYGVLPLLILIFFDLIAFVIYPLLLQRLNLSAGPQSNGDQPFLPGFACDFFTKRFGFAYLIGHGLFALPAIAALFSPLYGIELALFLASLFIGYLMYGIPEVNRATRG